MIVLLWFDRISTFLPGCTEFYGVLWLFLVTFGVTIVIFLVTFRGCKLDFLPILLTDFQELAAELRLAKMSWS